MADDKATLKIGSEFDNKGIVQAKKELGEVQDATAKTGEANTSMADKFVLKWAAIAGGIKAGLALLKNAWEFAKFSVNAYAQNARAVNTLSASLKAVGITSQEAIKQAQRFASEMQSATGIADEAFLNAQRLMANYGIVGKEAEKAIKSAYALSQGVNMDFESALLQIAKAAAGSTASLSRYGIVLDDGAKKGDKFNEVLRQINEKFGAAAQASMNDTITKTEALKQEWGDFKELLGRELAPLMLKLVEYARDFVDGLSTLFNQPESQKRYQKNMDEIAKLQKQINKENERAIMLYSEYGKISGDVNKKYIDEANAKRQARINELKAENKAIEEQWYLEAKKAKEDRIQLEAQQEKVRQAYQQKISAESQLKTEKQITDEVRKQAETYRQNALQSSKERSVKFQANISTMDLQGLASADDQLEQERILQEQLTEIKRQALEKQLDDARNAQDRQTEAGQEAYENALTQLEEFNVEKQILDEEYLTNRLALDQRIQESNKAVYEVEKFLQSQKVQDFQKGLNAMAQLQNSKSKELVAVGKAAGIAQATIDTAQGAIAAYQAMAHIPYIGPALGIAAAAAITAYGAERIAEIGGIKMAEGGLVKATTGGVPAIIGEGGSDEAVLPLNDTKTLSKIGDAIGNTTQSADTNVTITVNVNATGGLPAFLTELTEATRNGVTEALQYANIAVKTGNKQGGYSI